MLLTLAILSLLCALIPFGLMRANLALYTPPPVPPAEETLPPVSILIPARNEEANIAAALRAALASVRVDFEIVVLDDNSTDATVEIVQSYAQKDSRIRLERAAPLPPGWCGKMHACHQLAALARHPNLLFIDADVRLEPHALVRLVPLLSRAELWSGVPRQITETFSEQLLIPLINFVLLGYLPIARMRQSLDPALGAGCGQLFLTTAEAYRKSGGHAAIRTSMHDGLELPRLYRRVGLRTDLTDVTPVASCRLYDSNRATWVGLAKNAHEGMGSWRVIFPMTFLLGFGQVAPALLIVHGFVTRPRPIALSFFGSVEMWTLLLSVLAFLLSLFAHAWRAARFDQRGTSALLHPLGVVCLLGIQWWARLRTALKLGATWKGRTYHGG